MKSLSLAIICAVVLLTPAGALESSSNPDLQKQIRDLERTVAQMDAAGEDKGDSQYQLLLNLLRRLYNQKGDTQKEEEILMQSLQLDPTNHYYLLDYAQFLEQNGRLPEAEKQFKRVAGIGVANASKAANPKTFDETGMKDLIRDALMAGGARAVELNPEPNVEPLLQFYQRQNRFAEAETEYRKQMFEAESALKKAEADQRLNSEKNAGTNDRSRTYDKTLGRSCVSLAPCGSPS
jgi:tetratricopeptide (TPR) repeat protein